MSIEQIAAEKKPDPRADLAIEGTELALERTHLAWIRTMFTIITAGIAIDKGFALLHQQRMEHHQAFLQNAHLIGILLTAFGTVLLVIETFQFNRRNKQLAEMKVIKPVKATSFSTSTALALLVIFLGLSLILVMLTTT